MVDKAFIIKRKKTHVVLQEKKILTMLSHPKPSFTFQGKYSLYYVLDLALNRRIALSAHQKGLRASLSHFDSFPLSFLIRLFFVLHLFSSLSTVFAVLFELTGLTCRRAS